MKTELSLSGGTLFLVFLILKLTHEIDWSWWYITMPLWIGWLIIIAIAIPIIIWAFITEVIIPTLKGE
jgi:hypothetical protein